MRCVISPYPFGMLMNERTFSSENYRWGFNGKEMDDEVSGAGNQYDYGFRIYNPRIGKFLSVDPLSSSYPWYSPYQFAGNKPIWAIDLDGLEEVFYLTKWRYNFKTFFKLIQSDQILKEELWDPISKTEKRGTHRVYFTCMSKTSFQRIKLEPDVQGLTTGPSSFIDLSQVALNIVDYYFRISDDNPYNNGISNEELENLNQMKAVFSDMGFDSKSLVELANLKKQGKSVFFVILNSDVYKESSNKSDFKKFAHTVGHEIALHLKNRLNNVPRDPRKEHQIGFGKYSIHTPPDEQIPKNSLLGRLFQNIDRAIDNSNMIDDEKKK